MSNFTPWWDPKSLEVRLENLYIRNAVRSGIQVFFANQDFTEVETPALQECPGMEPHLFAFATDLESPGVGKRKRFLHTSPEFAMKKLLAGGMRRIYQFARVFRNKEGSSTHHPEFTMLEWYRAGVGYEKLMEDCESLLTSVLEYSRSGLFRFHERSCDPRKAWQKITVHDAFQQYAMIDLSASLENPDCPDAEILRKQAENVGVRVIPDHSWDDIFFKLFLERVERNLGIGAPTILYEYPKHMAALSKISASNPAVAERFELYVCGLELANAFSELTDPKEQRSRFEKEQAIKQELYGFSYPIDEDFLAALKFGYPESAGIALGFDRLVMLTAGVDSINEVLWAPVQ